jgi:hypothetical protein
LAGVFPPLAKEVFLTLQILKSLPQNGAAANKVHDSVVFAGRKIVRAVKQGLYVQIRYNILNQLIFFITNQYHNSALPTGRCILPVIKRFVSVLVPKELKDRVTRLA